MGGALATLGATIGVLWHRNNKLSDTIIEILKSSKDEALLESKAQQETLTTLADIASAFDRGGTLAERIALLIDRLDRTGASS